MSIKTFYWDTPTAHPAALFIKRKLFDRGWNDFRYGNAGDILARDLINYFYPGQQIVLYGKDQGPKLLTVGSVAHCSQSGDILFGSGCKSPDIPRVTGTPPFAHALRGPLSLEAARKAGYDVSNVAYLADPGLIIPRLVEPVKPVSNRVIFIPHYRERRDVRGRIPTGIEFVDIDATPADVARRIMEAELVFTSSLHGIIFSHALGRPCVPVRPQTEEPGFKYQDYFLSMGLDQPVFLDGIEMAGSVRKPVSPVTLPIKPEAITAPPLERLLAAGIATP